MTTLGPCDICQDPVPVGGEHTPGTLTTHAECCPDCQGDTMTTTNDLADGLPEDLHIDIESAIHQYMGHDGQSDEANDWVTDLMSEISPFIVRALVDLVAEVERLQAESDKWRMAAEAMAEATPGLTADEFRAKYLAGGDQPAPTEDQP